MMRMIMIMIMIVIIIMSLIKPIFALAANALSRDSVKEKCFQLVAEGTLGYISGMMMILNPSGYHNVFFLFAEPPSARLVAAYALLSGLIIWLDCLLAGFLPTYSTEWTASGSQSVHVSERRKLRHWSRQSQWLPGLSVQEMSGQRHVDRL